MQTTHVKVTTYKKQQLIISFTITFSINQPHGFHLLHIIIPRNLISDTFIMACTEAKDCKNKFKNYFVQMLSIPYLHGYNAIEVVC